MDYLIVVEGIVQLLTLALIVRIIRRGVHTSESVPVVTPFTAHPVLIRLYNRDSELQSEVTTHSLLVAPKTYVYGGVTYYKRPTKVDGALVYYSKV